MTAIVWELFPLGLIPLGGAAAIHCDDKTRGCHATGTRHLVFNRVRMFEDACTLTRVRSGTGDLPLQRFGGPTTGNPVGGRTLRPQTVTHRHNGTLLGSQPRSRYVADGRHSIASRTDTPDSSPPSSTWQLLRRKRVGRGRLFTPTGG